MARGRQGTALVLLLVLLPATGAAQPTSFSAADAKKLEAGEILTQFWKQPDGAGAGWAVGVIDATPEQVFRVIADVERYKDFMKRMTESRIVSRSSPERYRFYYRIDMPWPIADYSCVTDNRNELDPKRRIYARRWTLVSGTFLKNEGSWSVRPYPGGRALLSYQVVLLPTTHAPNVLLRYATKIALPRSVRQFRERVAALIRAGRR